MSGEYAVDNVFRHEEGFFIAEVTCYRTQMSFKLHDRWGSWFISDDPMSHGGRAPETISRNLPFDLQERVAVIKKRLDGLTANPFVTTPSNNPFMKFG